MAVRIYLIDGKTTFTVDEPREQVEEAFQAAREVNGVLRIRNGEGRVRSINPDQVLYFENVDDEPTSVFEKDAAPSADPRVAAR